MNLLHLYNLSPQSLALTIVLAILAGCFVSFFSALFLWLTEEQKLAAFIVGFALIGTMSVAQAGLFIHDRKDYLLFEALPLLVCFAYFLPSIMAIAEESTITRGVFLTNICLGWTGIGWLAAMVMAFRRDPNEDYRDLDFRLTPLGLVARRELDKDGSAQAQIERVVVPPASYTPALRREL
jgi:hypothetical protein